MAYDFAKTHDRIMKSARDHFMDKGFSGASIRQICKDAGVTNGAFYAHFASKEDLFDKIVRPVVDGMKELYDEENLQYMDIRSADDVKRALEQTFSSNRMLIRYLYEHADIFRLILTAGAGTVYEDFVENLAKEEAGNTAEFLKICGNYIGNTEMISETLIKHIAHFVVSSVFDGLIAGKTEKEVVHDTEVASEFCIAGIKHLLGI
ncbi:MAG: TetR/AcrR family transcriptional regulator [Lachnospiraceae bacterium]|nr:TetR/AcrR family transcriptional regulator [Lachnospiraceae bacterium]